MLIRVCSTAGKLFHGWKTVGVASKPCALLVVVGFLLFSHETQFLPFSPNRRSQFQSYLHIFAALVTQFQSTFIFPVGNHSFRCQCSGHWNLIPKKSLCAITNLNLSFFGLVCWSLDQDTKEHDQWTQEHKFMAKPGETFLPVGQNGAPPSNAISNSPQHIYGVAQN